MGVQELYRRNENLLNEYEDILLGNRKVFSDQFFGVDRPESQRNALAVMQYAFERYLRWPPNVIARRITKEMIMQLHLNTVIKYIKFPPEYSKERDFFYLVVLLYPNMHISRRKRITYAYRKVLERKGTKFPKDYFIGEEGIVRACVCLQYLLTDILQGEITCPADAYAMFASVNGLSCLRKYKLLPICDELFQTPVDFLHMALPVGERDDFLCMYYKYIYYTTMFEEDGSRKPIPLKPCEEKKLEAIKVLC